MITHPTCPSEAPNSSWMLGTETLTIELFRTEMKTAEIKTARSSLVPPARASPVPAFFAKLIGLSLSDGPKLVPVGLF